MTQHSFVYSKLTRGLTALCTCVLLAVSVCSFMLGFRNLVGNAQRVNGTGINDGTVIIIDPGHGGEDGGAQSKTGIIEKYINMAVCDDLNDIFCFFGYTTVLTRTDDNVAYDQSCKTVRERKVWDIKNRMAIMNSYPDAVFLSIHQNHYDGASSCGTQVFYSANNPKSEEIAESIQKTIVGDIQQDNKRLIKKSGKEIYLLYHAENPAVMVECGFLSNNEEAEKLNTEEYRRIMAFEIFKGCVAAL